MHFYRPRPDTSLRCEFPGLGLVDQGNVSVVAAAQSCSSFLPTRRRMARLSRPRACVCKFPAQWNYAVSRVPNTGFEPGTVRLRIQRPISCATTPQCRSTMTLMVIAEHFPHCILVAVNCISPYTFQIAILTLDCICINSRRYECEFASIMSPTVHQFSNRPKSTISHYSELHLPQLDCLPSAPRPTDRTPLADRSIDSLIIHFVRCDE